MTAVATRRLPPYPDCFSDWIPRYQQGIAAEMAGISEPETTGETVRIAGDDGSVHRHRFGDDSEQIRDAMGGSSDEIRDPETGRTARATRTWGRTILSDWRRAPRS